MNSLNPVIRIGEQMMLTMREHGEEGERDELMARVIGLLEKVGLKPEAARSIRMN